jgi:hypothetical protein
VGLPGPREVSSGLGEPFTVAPEVVGAPPVAVLSGPVQERKRLDTMASPTIALEDITLPWMVVSRPLGTFREDTG